MGWYGGECVIYMGRGATEDKKHDELVPFHMIVSNCGGKSTNPV